MKSKAIDTQSKSVSIALIIEKNVSGYEWEETLMKYLIGIFGLVLILGIAWLASNNRKKVKYRPIITMVILQFILGFYY